LLYRPHCGAAKVRNWRYGRSVQKLRLDIWSDIACPWCYIGKRHLEQALETFEHKDEVEVVWRAYELDPTAPKLRKDVTSNVERLAKKYRVTEADAVKMMDRVIGAGEAAGLDLKLKDSKSGNTFDAHRMLHWALEQGKQDALKERMMRAYQTESAIISDHDVLVNLAVDVGLDETEARAVVDSDRFTAEVRADEALAKELGITGVPFFVLANKIGVSGAQPVETMKLVLQKAWAERPQLETSQHPRQCAPDGDC
jgi:predicted DsbA family dithiol-disulfide isomerase